MYAWRPFIQSPDNRSFKKGKKKRGTPPQNAILSDNSVRSLTRVGGGVSGYEYRITISMDPNGNFWSFSSFEVKIKEG